MEDSDADWSSDGEEDTDMVEVDVDHEQMDQDSASLESIEEHNQNVAAGRENGFAYTTVEVNIDCYSLCLLQL